MNREEFLLELKNCISEVIDEIDGDNLDELCSFGIFTNQDISTISLVYNTKDNSAGQLPEYRWSMPEWFKEIGDENEYVDSINDLLYNEVQPKEIRIDPENFKDNILDVMTQALLELKREGKFSFNNQIVIYLEQADSYMNDIMKGRLKKLLGEELFQAFLREHRY